jgi:hypothetical protein
LLQLNSALLAVFEDWNYRMKIHHILYVALLLACAPSDSVNQIITDDEYEVFTASILFLNDSSRSYRFILSDSTIYEEHVRNVRAFLEVEFPGNSEKIADNFIKINSKHYPLDSTKFDFEYYPRLLEIREMFKYLNKINYESNLEYSDYTMSYYFSRVGFNSEHSKAIIYIAQICGGLCGNGYFLFLEKVDGIWKVIKKIHLWVS